MNYICVLERHITLVCFTRVISSPELQLQIRSPLVAKKNSPLVHYSPIVFSQQCLKVRKHLKTFFHPQTKTSNKKRYNPLIQFLSTMIDVCSKIETHEWICFGGN